jgi:menaquinone-dependent protoporphyrinogen oxidase
MKVLIAYRTRYGTTAACAKRLAERIGAETAVLDLARDRDRAVAAAATADVVLIGGSIYGGKIQREVPAFCERQREPLLERPVGLFICCLYRGERAMEELASSFPEWLLAHAFDRRPLGGEVHPERLTLVDRVLLRGLEVPRGGIAAVQADAIEELARAVTARRG